MSGIAMGCTRICARFFEYDTPKIVHIRSFKVGILYRFVQLVIIAYIIGVVMVYKKGYQEFDNVESTVTSKVKGVVMTNNSMLNSTGNDVRVWDTADYVVPPQENGAFFVTTNYIMTPDQEQGICPEQGATCTSDADCPAKSQSANGIRNGTCNTTTNTCNIYAWCPVETDMEPSVPMLQGTETFTVLIKNQIIFPKFGVRRRNILDSFATNNTYLSGCHYDPVTDPYCPIFRLGDIVRLAGENYTELAVKGAVMGFVIQWDCNLDLAVEKCRPKYSFRRIDNRDDVTAKGWNFRYANYWNVPGNSTTTIQKRTLIKAFGIRFIFYVYGTAGKFNFVPMATNLGAGLALLGLSVIVCDMILLYCTKKREFYHENKFVMVKDDDALLVEDSVKSNYSYRDFNHSDA
ncbi:P2X purinoceptor 4-like isoform X2 [Paramacrobiotus metropolitanus]|uniref:P2X purinoceptor 4-like isoform X2 n=1 Tax=Paramacrobiotus metropolitanus TaxID=2943436 RepID=UPI0024459C71|nr:P2X purinoceptor 4-like isoform X2 [Paramacrobiotus metropolitanus]